jgi:hypothetical protein
MLDKITMFLFKLLKGDSELMAMLFAQRIILGKSTFAQVPALLKEQVREILIDSGVGYLAEE